ncbi:hypothetical protein F66182_17936, partial [Fusarium sp. NRRL 66182]
KAIFFENVIKSVKGGELKISSNLRSRTQKAMTSTELFSEFVWVKDTSTDFYVVHVNVVLQSLFAFFDQFFGPSNASLQALIELLTVNEQFLMFGEIEHELLFIINAMTGVVFRKTVRADGSIIQRILVTLIR